jgi:CRISPR system Cascade subunit CasD
LGVRVDREGVLTYDYHTAQDVLKAGGGLKDTEVSRRYYLADASFLVGLEGELSLLRLLHAALHDPVWPLYLGRKAFAPGDPIWLADGLQAGVGLEAALRAYPWQIRPGQAQPERLRLVLEDAGGSEVRPDQPLSFQSSARRFAPRRIKTDWMALA